MARESFPGSNAPKPETGADNTQETPDISNHETFEYARYEGAQPGSTVAEEKLRKMKEKHTPDHAQGGGHAAHHDSHGHENPAVKWGLKQPFAIFGFLFGLAWQGLKSMGSMGKGGGGGAAKSHGGGHGGGGHH